MKRKLRWLLCLVFLAALLAIPSTVSADEMVDGMRITGTGGTDWTYDTSNQYRYHLNILKDGVTVSETYTGDAGSLWINIDGDQVSNVTFANFSQGTGKQVVLRTSGNTVTVNCHGENTIDGGENSNLLIQGNSTGDKLTFYNLFAHGTLTLKNISVTAVVQIAAPFPGGNLMIEDSNVKARDITSHNNTTFKGTSQVEVTGPGLNSLAAAIYAGGKISFQLTDGGWVKAGGTDDIAMYAKNEIDLGNSKIIKPAGGEIGQVTTADADTFRTVIVDNEAAIYAEIQGADAPAPGPTPDSTDPGSSTGETPTGDDTNAGLLATLAVLAVLALTGATTLMVRQRRVH
ncbi:MAG: hypothetical protein Q4C25_04445 [Bacillota bacterium]|nr:hypothetical protein [Bacillota bacterium]